MVTKRAVKRAMKRLARKIASGIIILAIEFLLVFSFMWYGLQVATTLR